MPTSYYLQVGLALLVFAGLLMVALQASKKLQQTKFTGDIQVKDRRAVDQQVCLMLVKVYETEYLLGVTQRSCQVLDTYTKLKRPKTTQTRIKEKVPS